MKKLSGWQWRLVYVAITTVALAAAVAGPTNWG